jgi:alkylation response protein AidB-like acyl-CoA dehydrogenase
MSDDARRLLADTAIKVFSNLPEHPIPAMRLWQEAGLDKVMAPEETGGFGGGWEDALIVLRIAGAHADISGLDLGIIKHAARKSGFEDMALATTCEMAGAMEAALELTVQYARERQQFGKALSTFQAIQQQLAVFAEDVAATNMAAASACRARDRGPAHFEIAAAKLRANMAVGTVTSVAHQVHGAMGFTKEYKLQRLTKALWQWRSDYGNDRFWSDELGRIVARQGADGFWPALVNPSTAVIPG